MINWKDILIRSAKTFVQAFIPVLIVALSAVDITDLSATKSVAYSALISACSAGLSAVWNSVTNLLKASVIDENDDDLDEEEEIETEEEIVG